jgi:hypothetical protein
VSAFRVNNPLNSRLLPLGEGVTHIGFSRGFNEEWYVVINERSTSDHSAVKKFVVNQVFEELLRSRNIPFKGEGRNKNAPEVDFRFVSKTIELIGSSGITLPK